MKSVRIIRTTPVGSVHRDYSGRSFTPNTIFFFILLFAGGVNIFKLDFQKSGNSAELKKFFSLKISA